MVRDTVLNSVLCPVWFLGNATFEQLIKAMTVQLDSGGSTVNAASSIYEEIVLSEDLSSQHGSDGRTAIARRYTESAEAWLRKLVHANLFARSGSSYITAGDWNKPLRTYVEAKYRESPSKYTREVDATTFEQLIDMVCHPQHWSKWSDALKEAYPEGAGEARTFLCRLQTIRNNVSHGQVCSGRQLEQAICYTNDLADSIKNDFRRKGLSREFNVPTFVRVLDNLGNSEHLTPGHHFRGSDFSETGTRVLYPGDTLIAEVEVDPSFDASGYDVVWWVKTTSGSGYGTKAIIPIENRHVGERMELQFKLTTKLDWHRGGGYDDALDIYYKVLPP